MPKQSRMTFKQKVAIFNEKIFEIMQDLDDSPFKNFITRLLDMIYYLSDDVKFNIPTLKTIASAPLKMKWLSDAYDAFNTYELVSPVEYEILHHIKNFFYGELFKTIEPDDQTKIVDYVIGFSHKITDYALKYKYNKSPHDFDTASLVPTGGPDGGSSSDINILQVTPVDSTGSILEKLHEVNEKFLQEKFEEKVNVLTSHVETFYNNFSIQEHVVQSGFEELTKILLSIEDEISSTFNILAQHVEDLKTQIDLLEAEQSKWSEYQSKKSATTFDNHYNESKNSADLEYLNAVYAALLAQETLTLDDKLAEKLNLSSKDKTYWDKQVTILSDVPPAASASTLQAWRQYIYNASIQPIRKFVVKENFNQWLQFKLEDRIEQLEIQHSFAEKKATLETQYNHANLFLAKLTPYRTQCNELVKKTNQIIKTTECKENIQVIVNNINRVIKNASSIISQIFDFFTGKRSERMKIIKQFKAIMVTLNNATLIESIRRQSPEKIDEICQAVTSINVKQANKKNYDEIMQQINKISETLSVDADDDLQQQPDIQQPPMPS